MDRLRTPLRRLLHMPLLFKLVLINSFLTALLAFASAVVAVQHVQAFPEESHYDLIPLFLAIGLGISLTIGVLMIRVILTPLDQLSAAVEDARHGKGHIPPVISPIGDEQIDHLSAGMAEIQGSLEKNAQEVRHLSERVIYAQEEERQRIARELHDEAAQTLTSLLLYLKLLEKSSPPQEAQRLQNLRKLTAHALSEIRRQVMELHPQILDKLGLEAALEQRVDELNTNGAVRVSLKLEGCATQHVSRDLELTFYRVAQEALSNVALHSHARCASITLKQDAPWLTLEVQDDGVGFNPNVIEADQSCSFGLTGMRERLALVGGELTIESQPGSGTHLYARAPLFVHQV